MTDILLDPNDTGEIPRYDSLGDDPTRNLREERDAILAATGRLRHHDPVPTSLVTGHGYDPEAHHGPVIEMDETVLFHAPNDLAGPQNPPPPLPPVPPTQPKYDMAAAQPLWPLERVAGAEETQVHTILHSLTATVDGELAEAEPTLRRSVPYVIPANARPWSRPRHRAPAPAWTRYAIGVGAVMVVWAAVVLAVHL